MLTDSQAPAYCSAGSRSLKSSERLMVHVAVSVTWITLTPLSALPLWQPAKHTPPSERSGTLFTPFSTDFLAELYRWPEKLLVTKQLDSIRAWNSHLEWSVLLCIKLELKSGKIVIIDLNSKQNS